MKRKESYIIFAVVSGIKVDKLEVKFTETYTYKY